MKICFPSMGYRSLDERTAMECGRSQFYSIVDSDGTLITSIPGDLIFTLGLKTLARWLSRRGVEALVTRDIDEGAVTIFEEAGIRVSRVDRETLRESLAAFTSGRFEDMGHMPHRRHEIEISIET